MSVTLVPTSDDLTVDATVTAAALTARRATTFLRAQAQWLSRGVQQGDDRVAVAIVLSAHDRSHDRWVAMLGQVATVLGDDIADHLAAVYGHLGRVAEALAQGALELLAPSTAAMARQLVVERLTDVTELAVEALWGRAAQV
ncbi:MAG TPA: hypothetical protein VM307_14485 [Egibacteraceae bacterium]|nr:hypothetical protein [Egibacteraceae bacterium]